MTYQTLGLVEFFPLNCRNPTTPYKMVHHRGQPPHFINTSTMGPGLAQAWYKHSQTVLVPKATVCHSPEGPQVAVQGPAVFR